MSDYLEESRKGVEVDLMVALELADTPQRCTEVSREAEALSDLCRIIEREARLKAHTLLMEQAATIGAKERVW